MTRPAPATDAGDRRRTERRTNARIGDLTLPEFRRILVTTTLFAIVAMLFVWMVRTVIIAAILGIVIAVYVRPLYTRFLRVTRGRTSPAALLTLLVVILPILASMVYSYDQIRDATNYLASHEDEVAARIDSVVHRVPYLERVSAGNSVRTWVLRASDYGAAIPDLVRKAIVGFAVATTIFLFTAFYLFTDGESVLRYVRGKLPPRYSELVGALETNVRGVLYGAIYATLITQALKSAVILILMLFFRVPLAAVLAILSFIIGFFPIVGSWSVYLPVAAWLLVFRDDPVGAAVMVLVGGLLNTIFISMFLRPKLAADKSRVLNFYWMFVGLVTGVYTFGLAGILLGPILIGLLKAVLDTVTATSSWRLIEAEADEPAVPA